MNINKCVRVHYVQSNWIYRSKRQPTRRTKATNVRPKQNEWKRKMSSIRIKTEVWCCVDEQFCSSSKESTFLVIKGKNYVSIRELLTSELKRRKIETTERTTRTWNSFERHRYSNASMKEFSVDGKSNVSSASLQTMTTFGECVCVCVCHSVVQIRIQLNENQLNESLLCFHSSLSMRLEMRPTTNRFVFSLFKQFRRS